MSSIEEQPNVGAVKCTSECFYATGETCLIKVVADRHFEAEPAQNRRHVLGVVARIRQNKSMRVLRVPDDKGDASLRHGLASSRQRDHKTYENNQRGSHRNLRLAKPRFRDGIDRYR